MVEFPVDLKTAKDVTGALRRINDGLGAGRLPFRFTTVERLVREILKDYHDPYEVVIVLARAVDDGDLALDGAVWHSLDLRAYGRLRAGHHLPEGWAWPSYFFEFVAAKCVKYHMYVLLAEWEDSCDWQAPYNPQRISEIKNKLDFIIAGDRVLRIMNIVGVLSALDNVLRLMRIIGDLGGKPVTDSDSA